MELNCIRFRSAVLILAAGALGLGLTAPAAADPPTRGSRLGYVSGEVSFRPGSVDDWSRAELNRPVVAGDHLWSDQGARAELNIGLASVRLGSNTAISILDFDDDVLQVRLSEGSMNIRLRRLDDDQIVEIDTPNAAVSLVRRGNYRIDVGQDGDVTRVTIREGEAEVSAAGSTFPLRRGELATVSGYDDASYDIEDAHGTDSFDRWCRGRDRRQDRSASLRYVPSGLLGYEDLDETGRWRNVSGYGSVWFPTRISSDWAPFRDGHWAWIDPWGWTWIDNAPWGYATSHYGRWGWIDNRWGWVSVSRNVQPVYVPAAVAFLGGGSVSISIGGPSVSWYPLGPGEAYVPSFNAGNRFLEQLHASLPMPPGFDRSGADRKRGNQNVPRAITSVSTDVFVNARPIASAAIRIAPPAAAGMRSIGSAPPIPPRVESVARRAPGAAPVPRPPAPVADRPVVSRSTPPAPPVPFESRVRTLEQNPGKPVEIPQRAPRPIPGAMPDARPAPMPGRPDNPLVRPAAPTPPGGSTRPALRPMRENLPAPRPVEAAPPRPRGEPGPDGPAAPGRPDSGAVKAREARPAVPAPDPEVRKEAPPARPTATPAPRTPGRPTPAPDPTPAPSAEPSTRPPVKVDSPANPTAPAPRSHQPSREERVRPPREGNQAPAPVLRGDPTGNNRPPRAGRATDNQKEIDKAKAKAKEEKDKEIEKEKEKEKKEPN